MGAGSVSRRPRSICPTAILRIRRNISTSCAGWTGSGRMPTGCSRSRNHWFWRVTTMSFPRRSTRRAPENWTSDALFLPQTRARFREILEPRTDRRTAPVTWRRTWTLHLLGLSGRRLAEEQRHSDRPPAVVAAGCGSSDGSARRQTCPGLGAAVGPRARHCDVQMKRPVALRQRARRYLMPAPVTCRRA